MPRELKRIFSFNLSVGTIIGAIIVLAVVSAVFGFKHYQHHKQQAIELLTEKGATLIRSFEAGLRSSFNAKNEVFMMQKLLMENARHPDIDYIIITDYSGNVIADSDPAQVGDKYGLELEIKNIASFGSIRWRQVVNVEGAGTFEVYRGLSPLKRMPDKKSGGMIIYVGLNMTAIEKAAREDARNTVIISLILLLVGSSVIVLLFFIQAYRAAHSSLSRMTVFSKALVKNMPAGLIAIDNQGTVISCNENAQSFLNIRYSEAPGKNSSDILSALLQEIFLQLPRYGGLLEKDIHLESSEGHDQIWETVAAGMSEDGKPAGKILLLGMLPDQKSGKRSGQKPLS